MPVTVVFGAGGIGTGNFASTWDTPDKVSALLSSLTELGINQLGSAALYPPGNPWDTETPLGQARAVEKGFRIDTKILYSPQAEERRMNLSKRGIDSSLEKSLGLLKIEKASSNTRPPTIAIGKHSSSYLGSYPLRPCSEP